MYKIHKRALAEKDIKNIWLYTYEQWGETQADRYYDELEYGIKSLGHNPHLGKKRDTLRQGYYAFTINRHVVYYRVEASTIHIIRVLHECMDPAQHL